MSTPFYDLASLVVVPSGYKSGKIYAQKPLTTDGQLTFTRASTATRVNASGLIETVSSGVPRLDYLGSSCPKILLEPQRSNIITQSQTFDNAAWTKYNGATVTANTVVSPDGTQNADTLNAPAASTQEIYNGGSKAASAITYTFSCFAKYNGSIFTMVASDFATSATTANFNLQTGTVTSISVGATWSNGSAKIENYGNGWYRCIFTATSPATSGLYISLVGTTYIFGCQIEEGAYATSYIPTTSAAVTRLRDDLAKTGISSLIGQTSGTVFVEFEFSGSKDTFWPVMTVMGASSAELIEIYGSAGSNSVGVYMLDGGSAQFSRTRALTIGRHKLAIAYELNNTVAYLDGTVMGGIDTSCTIPTMTQIGIGEFAYSAAYTFGDRINQALLFTTRLTDAQLAELTTL